MRSLFWTVLLAAGLWWIAPETAAGESAVDAHLKLVHVGDMALRNKDVPGAIRSFSDAIETLRKESENTDTATMEPLAQAYYKRATARLIEGVKDKALADLGAALDAFPLFMRARLRRAREFLSSGNANEAAQDCSFIVQNGGTDGSESGDKKAATVLSDAQKVAESAAVLAPLVASAQRERENTDASVAEYDSVVDDVAPREHLAKQITASASRCVAAWAAVLERASSSTEARAARAHCALAPTLIRESALSDAERTELLSLVIDDAMAVVKAGGSASDDVVVSALASRARAFFGLGQLDAALQHVKKALKHDPDHKDAKRAFRAFKRAAKAEAEVDAAVGKRKWTDGLAAADELDEAAWLAGSGAWLAEKLHRRKCECAANVPVTSMSKPQRLALCSKALEWAQTFQPDNADLVVNVLAWRAETHMSSKDDAEPADWDAALGDAQHAMNKAGGDGNLRYRANEILQRAQKGKKIAARVDHYKVLGVSRTASQQDIKKAYRKLARDHHPDKIADDLAQSEKDHLQSRYIMITQAYEILSDEDLRRRWEAGEDVETHSEREGQAGGRQGFPFGGGGGFPGGFNFQFRHG